MAAALAPGRPAVGTGTPFVAGLALAACLLAAPSPAAADAAPPTDWTPVQLPAAQQLDLRAAGNGQRYRLFVAAPAGPVPAAGHPVLYVLDGNAAFPVAAWLARSVAARREFTGQVPPLVVGIGYPGDLDFDVPARQRDYTPGAGAGGRPADSDPPGEGRATPFLDVIEHEIKPLIAARHRVDASRQALFGHSFGGLFVLHTLFTRPQAFSTYLASSPSIWWREQQVLAGLPAMARLAPAQRPRVQISVGALEDQPPRGQRPPELLALLARRRMVEPARALAERLRALPGWAERVSLHELAGEDHGTAWLPAMARGMQLFVDAPTAANGPRP